jgi:putative methyltransferase (TIGR04325 family)
MRCLVKLDTRAMRASILKQLLPPVVAGPLRARFGSVRYRGDFPSWAEALQRGSGYAAPDILAKVEAAALRVKRGEAVFERDSMLLPRIDHSPALLAGLLLAACRSGGRLHVLDFGGGLGTSYQQNRRFLQPGPELRWSIVEQPHFVEAGLRNFADGTLDFHVDIASCLRAGTPNVALLSSSLPYLESPHETLQRILSLDLEVVVIDRTAFIEGPRDRLCVQTVVRDIHPASYPAWFFSRSRFLRSFDERFTLVEEFENPHWNVNVASRQLGYVFCRTRPALSNSPITPTTRCTAS